MTTEHCIFRTGHSGHCMFVRSKFSRMEGDCPLRRKKSPARPGSSLKEPFSTAGDPLVGNQEPVGNPAPKGAPAPRPRNPYAESGRAKKVARLLDALDQMFGHATPADVLGMTEAQAQDMLKRADCTGERTPSDETIQMLADRLKNRQPKALFAPSGKEDHYEADPADINEAWAAMDRGDGARIFSGRRR